MKEIKKRELREYTTENGEKPYLIWLLQLDMITRQRIRARLDRVEAGNFGDSEPVGQGVSELRFHFGPGYRIYYTDYEGTIIILLNGGDKKSQKKDIKKAISYWQELQERQNG